MGNRGDRMAHLTRIRLVRWLGVAFGLVLMLPAFTMSPALAADYRLSDLASPISVAPGMEISIVANRSLYLFFAGSEPGQSLQFRGTRNGIDVWGPFSGLAGMLLMDPGARNLTFQSSGRIAVGLSLRQMCQHSETAVPGSGTLTCPQISVSETMAFGLFSIDATFPTAYHVDGSVDSAFYDTYLRPVGTGPDGGIGVQEGILVVSPRGGATTVLISAHPVDDRAASVPIFVYALFAAGAMFTITVTTVGVLLLRRRRVR